MWLVPWLVAGCQPVFTEEIVAGTRHLSAQITSGPNGLSVVKVPVLTGETAMLATAQVDGSRQVHMRAWKTPVGEQVFGAFEWNDSPYSKTNAGFVSVAASLNWPIQAGDPDLVAGNWVLTVGVVDAATQYVSAPFTLDVHLKSDAAFDDGALEVSIIYAGEVGDDTALRDAVTEARDVWVDLYASMGIDVTFTTYTYSVGNLGAPAFGDEPAYEDIARQTAPRSVNLVLGETIDEIGGIFGIAGDIPGPLVPSPRSAVLISTLLAAGPDGEFSAEDIRLLGETMAHEVGHYLGMFHPVEAAWDAWDVLTDTPECTTEDECFDQLGENLMFPYPICGAVACSPQDQLTSDQASVAHRYVGVW